MEQNISGQVLAQKVRAFVNDPNPNFNLKIAFSKLQIRTRPSLNNGFENITQNKFGFIIEFPASDIYTFDFNNIQNRLQLATMLGELIYKVIDTQSPEHFVPTFRNETHKFDAQDFASELLMPQALIQKFTREQKLSFDDLVSKFQVLPEDLQKQMFKLEYKALNEMAKDRQLVR